MLGLNIGGVRSSFERSMERQQDGSYFVWNGRARIYQIDYAAKERLIQLDLAFCRSFVLTFAVLLVVGTVIAGVLGINTPVPVWVALVGAAFAPLAIHSLCRNVFLKRHGKRAFPSKEASPSFDYSGAIFRPPSRRIVIETVILLVLGLAILVLYVVILPRWSTKRSFDVPWLDICGIALCALVLIRGYIGYHRAKRTQAEANK